MKEEGKANVQLISDATDPNTGNTLLNYTSSIIASYVKELNVNNVTVIHSPELKFTLADIGYKKFGIILFNMSEINHEIEFSDILKITKEDSIFIFFSKNESIKNNHFWNKLKFLPNTTIYIQLFSMNLAFFRKEQYENEHYTIQF